MLQRVESMVMNCMPELCTLPRLLVVRRKLSSPYSLLPAGCDIERKQVMSNGSDNRAPPRLPLTAQPRTLTQ